GPENTSTALERERGLRVTLRSAGVTIDDRHLRRGPYIADTGYAGMHELMALGALNAARALGLSVPDDVSVVGFDDLPLAGWELVQLTTVHQPMEEMARTA